jgi:hypothetical protein
MPKELGRDSAIETTKKRLQKLTKGLTHPASGGYVEFSASTYRPSPADFPVPELLLFALRLLGFPSSGPEDKCRWTVYFDFLGKRASVSLRKFGFSISHDPELATTHLSRLEGQLHKAAQTVEALIEPLAKQEVQAGNFVIANRYSEFDRRYRYFRGLAQSSYKRARQKPRAASKPRASKVTTESLDSLSSMLTSDINRVRKHQVAGFFNATAMVDAFFSRLEHQAILLIAFLPSDSTESVFARMSKKWDEKLKAVLDAERDKTFKKIYADLLSLKERVRNPFSHGGVENDMGWMQIHIPGIGNVPANFSAIKHSVRFANLPVDEPLFESVCDLFDKLDGYMSVGPVKRAQRLIDAGVDPACDPGSRLDYAKAIRSERALTAFIDRWGYEWGRHTNMEY